MVTRTSRPLPSLNDLPPDQRAVVQLVLQTGQSYEDVAGLLDIDVAAVRERARLGLDALVPAGDVSTADQGVLVDYLLGQVPDDQRVQAKALLLTDATANAWAVEAGAALEEVAPGKAATVPESPLAAAAPKPKAAPAPEPEPEPEKAPEPEPKASEPEPKEPEPEPEKPKAKPKPAPKPKPTAKPKAEEKPEAEDADEDDFFVEDSAPAKKPKVAAAKAKDDDEKKAADDKPSKPSPVQRLRAPSSRLGGMLLIGGVAVVLVVLVIVLATRGGDDDETPAASSTPTTQTNAANQDVPVALGELKGSGKAKGAVQVVIRGQQQLLFMVGAEGVPTPSKNEAFAIWLDGGKKTKSKRLGFTQAQNGQLGAETPVPQDLADYKQLLVTRESDEKAKTPGRTVLSMNISQLRQIPQQQGAAPNGSATPPAGGATPPAGSATPAPTPGG